MDNVPVWPQNFLFLQRHLKKIRRPKLEWKKWLWFSGILFRIDGSCIRVYRNMGSQQRLGWSLYKSSQECDNYRLEYYFQKILWKIQGLNNTLPEIIRWLSIIRPQMWWQPHLLAWLPPPLRHQSPEGDGAHCDIPGTGNTALSQRGSPGGGGGASKSEILVRLIFWLQFTEFLHFGFSI